MKFVPFTVSVKGGAPALAEYGRSSGNGRHQVSRAYAPAEVFEDAYCHWTRIVYGRGGRDGIHHHPVGGARKGVVIEVRVTGTQAPQVEGA